MKCDISFVPITYRSTLADRDMRVNQVRLHGNHRTRPEVFEYELENAFQAHGINEIVKEIALSTKKLANLEIFDTIDIKLDKSNIEDPYQVDVVISVEEKDWKEFDFGVKTDAYDDSLEASCALINPLGTSEKFDFKSTYAWSGSHVESISLKKPQFMGYPLYFSTTVFNDLQNYEKTSSYSENRRGSHIAVSDPAERHKLIFKCDRRDILPKRNRNLSTAFHSSPSVLAEAEPSVKTSVEYHFQMDSRDNPIIPSSGGLLRFSTEAAGLLADVRFLKSQVEAQKHISYSLGSPKSVLNLSFLSRFGAMKSLNLQSPMSRISDRFFIGGPMSLRGFHHRGVGPRASPRDGGVRSGDSLGGDIFYTAAAHLGFPMPNPWHSLLGLRGQLFANLGNVTNWRNVKEGSLRNLVNDTRVAIGMGVVLPSSVGRMEASYCWILNALRHDHISRGQFGIGVTFS
uniref:Sorting and assembly machinery component 50 putativ n=1 Tax=Albugo laibachii Nc14 TaxID=890382 RepID=F0WHN1_9STRA|nr:sorting and assembly machinery component 50 putativ [Albugo laibachii Nc14]|eukprot:CCA20724.1 sorting and assembly machinery component 50 putativ [Albugo laibachii Nc14]